MFNETLVQMSETQSGKIAIETPFNREFVSELKALVPSARWSGSKWIINASGKGQAETLLAKYYPADNQLQNVRIIWDFSNGGQPEIDGVGLANVSRDYWSWRQNCPIDFKVISQSLKSGGSRKYPTLYGELVIETKIRQGATISNPHEIEILEDGESPNPLVGFLDEDLIAELIRRGYEIR